MLRVPIGPGSWEAFIPGGLVISLFVIRTGEEDRKLINDLADY